MAIIGEQSIPGGHELMLLYENRALESQGATVTATSTAAGNLVPGHVINPHLDLAWRSGSIAALVAGGASVVTLKILLGSPRQLDTQTLHKHNARTAWRWRWYKSTIGSSGGESPIFESPWLDPVVRARPGDFPTFTEMPWSLGPRGEELELWQATFDLTSVGFADQIYDNLRLVEIDFDLTAGTNNGVDYVQVGLAPSWLAFRPRIDEGVQARGIGADLGFAWGVQDRSVATRTESGALLGRRRSSGRTFDFDLGALARPEALQRILTQLARLRGKLARVFVWPETLQRRYFYDSAFIGTLTGLPRVAMARLELPAANAFRIEETE